MRVEWSRDDQSSMAFTGKLCLSVDTFDDGIAWSVSAIASSETQREKRRALFVHGFSDGIETGERAAEMVAERIRKGLRWAR